MINHVETFRCEECKNEWGRNYASFNKPHCPKCGENLDIEETTDHND